MEVKGAAVASIPAFIKAYHSENYDKWMESLSKESQAIMREVFASQWYPIDIALDEPTIQLCRLFYDGDLKGAWDNGRYSAEMALKGIYKVFVKFGSPAFIIKKASRILPTYYTPSSMETADLQTNSAILKITDFEGLDPHVEARIAGWIEQALELSGCKNLRIKTPKSITRGHTCTEFDISWD